MPPRLLCHSATTKMSPFQQANNIEAYTCRTVLPFTDIFVRTLFQEREVFISPWNRWTQAVRLWATACDVTQRVSLKWAAAAARSRGMHATRNSRHRR